MTGFQVSWSTNIAANSSIDYGTSSSYGASTPVDSTMVTNHQVPVSGLASGTLYHFRVRSTDAKSDLAVSSDMTFATAGDTTPPTVSITAPAANATLSGTVNVDVTANDNVGVKSVQLKIDNANSGAAVTAAPYVIAVNTSSLSNGNHILTAVASDAAGNSATSAQVPVKVNNTTNTPPPTVSITSPANGANVSGTLTVTATAASGVGVASVQFQLDGANFGSLSTTAPYSVSWNTTTSSNGAHTLRAIAKDTAGNSTTSASVTVTVNNTSTAPPTVSITSPANGANVSGTLTVTATAASSVGVASVQFQLDGANLGSLDMTAPYSVSWNTTTAANASHTLRAIAKDTAGNSTTSAGVTVTVNNSADTTPPTVPTGLSATALSSSQISLTWTASTDNVGVTGYNVFRGGVKIGTSATTSYIDNGLTASTSYTYNVSAFDAAGNTSAQSGAASATTQASSGGGGIPPTLGWFQIPNTAYQQVCPSYTDIQGQSGCAAVANAWGSGWADTKRNRMVLFGGGHTDYFGNEVYILDLNANPISMRLGKDASHGSAISNLNSCPDAYSDGNPGSRHDNDGMVYLASQDLYFIHGGNLANCGSFTNNYWTLNPTTMAWTRPAVPSSAPNPNLNGSSSTLDYDTVSGKVYMVETNANTFWQWTPATNVWTVLNGNVGGACDTHGYEHTSVIDPVRRFYFCVGVGDANKISLNAPYTVSNLSMTNCGTIASDTGAGLAYDSSQGLIVMWSGGNTVYLYNPDTDSCTSQTYTGGPGAQQSSGTYKRFQYFPGLGVFIVVNGSSQNAYSLRLTAGGGTNPVGPNISGVAAASITTSGATISWTTDVGATSQVEYGTTTSYGTLTTLNSSLVTSHSTVLTGLAASTLYHYRVHSKNSSGVESISNDLAFSTSGGGDITPPTVSMTSPAGGATLSGTVTVSASASDNVGVTSVQFQLDGASLGSPVTNSPYTVSWDTTTSANGVHVLAAQARDAAGNVGTALSVSVTVTNSLSANDTNFNNRRNSAGVIASEGWDATTDFIEQTDGTKTGFSYQTNCPTWPTACIQRDTSVFLSGGSSARWDIYGNTSEDQEGYWFQTFGQTFAQNSTFYIQFAFRADTNWVTTDWTQTGTSGKGTSPKILIAHGVDANGQPATCDNVQFVYRNENGWALPDMYSQCGQISAYTDPGGVNYFEGSTSLYQQGFTAPAPFAGYDCAYNHGSKPVGNCIFFQANTWYTIYLKLHIGTWGQPNSTVEAWIAPYGQQMKKMVNVMNYTMNSSSVAGFSGVTLTQYMTGKLASVSHPTAHVWYDELIISTQPIPAPAGQTP
jgi:chitodextrinase